RSTPSSTRSYPQMGKREKKVAADTARRTKGNKPLVPSTAVLPRVETSDDRICWRFCHVDQDGPWGFGELTIAELMTKLADFESMTLREIFNLGEEPGKHYDLA